MTPPTEISSWAYRQAAERILGKHSNLLKMLLDDARELDKQEGCPGAMVPAEVIERLRLAVAENNGSTVTITKADACAIGNALRMNQQGAAGDAVPKSEWELAMSLLKEAKDVCNEWLGMHREYVGVIDIERWSYPPQVEELREQIKALAAQAGDGNG